MTKLTLDYTVCEDGWYVGELRQMPNVISQGKTLDELKENILDALMLMLEDIAEELPAGGLPETLRSAKPRTVEMRLGVS